MVTGTNDDNRIGAAMIIKFLHFPWPQKIRGQSTPSALTLILSNPLRPLEGEAAEGRFSQYMPVVSAKMTQPDGYLKSIFGKSEL